MIDCKIELIKRIGHRRLALSADTNEAYLCRILAGKVNCSKKLAVNLSRYANAWTEYDVFEPNDFNPNLNPNLKNVCDEVCFVVTDRVNGRNRSVNTYTSKELHELYADDIDFIQALHNCVSVDGVHCVHNRYLIELGDNDND
tara:strand:- start:352 stop:780 length:429 start_codon:yes stop_codon:yes gene_type:complete